MSHQNLIEMIDPELLGADARDTRYDNSPFVHIKAMSAKQKGKAYELITENVLGKLGFTIDKPTNTEHDRIINGVKTEIKGSTLNKNTDHFSFLQIRPAQDYSELMFTMCYPHELVIMKMDKQTVFQCVEQNIFKKQHGGNKAESGTYLYYGNKETLEQIGAIYVI